MIILSIGSDANVFDSLSNVRARLMTQASLFDELHVVVVSRNIPKHTTKINDRKLFIYPVYSKFKPFLFLKAIYKMCRLTHGLKKRYGSERLYISSQDPFEVGIVALVVSKFFRIRLQFQLHTDCFNDLYARHSLSNYCRLLIARLIIARADTIRAVSSRITSSLRLLIPKITSKIYVLPVWFDIDKYKECAGTVNLNLRNKFPEFSKIILIVARLESEKNIELSLNAFHKMLRFNKTLGLVIVGTGSKESWLKKYSKHLGISDNIRFLGWQSDTCALYKSADVLLITSLYEGYGLTIVEALAAGLAVVSTDVGVARESGAVIVSYDAGEIALKTIEMIEKKIRLPSPHLPQSTHSEYLDKFKQTFN